MKYEDFTKKMLSAFEDTVEAYEILIETLETGTNKTEKKVIKKWGGYADGDCKLCVASDTRDRDLNCSDCVLYLKTDPYVSCIDGTAEGSRNEMVLATKDPLSNSLLEAAKARLKWLLKRAAQNDVVMK